jgi:hypothetical protein
MSMLPSRIKRTRPAVARRVGPGVFVAEDAHTGVYRFFPHSPPQFFVKGRRVGRDEYEKATGEPYAGRDRK